MSEKFLSLLLISLFLLTPGNHWRNSDPVVFTTQPKLANARLVSDEKIILEGRASLTVTKANDDDTVTGVLVYTIGEDARRKLADLTGYFLEEIPAKYSRENVTAKFIKGNTCPTLHLEIAPVELEAAGTTMKIDHVVLDIVETPQQMSQYFCAWARQINAHRQRGGIIAAINRLINPEN
jgi:hypothetical protein